MSKLRDAAQQALEALETVLSDAYHRRFPECCGRPGVECCGNPNEAWTPEDNKIMDLLSPAQRQLSDALRTALAEQPAEREPVRGEWQGYTWNPYAVSQPKAEPLTDEEIDNTIRKQVDDLLDHIYEYGTAAEGIDYRVRAIARAIEAAVRGDGK